MASIIKHTAFEPLVTGPLLWVLTKGSPDLRDRILRPLASLPFKVNQATLVTSLKWLLALGLVRTFNTWMTKWAMNKWQFSSDARPWVWPDEIAVVTGGSGGIGSEVCKRLAATGMKIAILDLQPPPASLKSFNNVYYYETDICDPNAVHEVAVKIQGELGHPTILFNNAGIGKTFNILDVSNEYLEKIFHINLISHWYTVREFLPGMIAAKKGHIISTASMASYSTVGGMVDYCVTKAGVMSFHEGLNQELKYKYNAPFIQTTAVHPYWVQTALLGDWESSIRSMGNPIMTPEFAGSHIAKQILSGKSGHLVLPPSGLLSAVVGARGWPHWMSELMRDSTKETTVLQPTAKGNTGR